MKSRTDQGAMAISTKEISSPKKNGPFLCSEMSASAVTNSSNALLCCSPGEGCVCMRRKKEGMGKVLMCPSQSSTIELSVADERGRDGLGYVASKCFVMARESEVTSCRDETVQSPYTPRGIGDLE